MKKVAVFCDHCGKDLTYTGNSVDYRLLVVSQSLHPQQHVGEMVAVTDMMIYPPVERAYHFCDLGCLQKHPLATGEASA